MSQIYLPLTTYFRLNNKMHIKTDMLTSITSVASANAAASAMTGNKSPASNSGKPIHVSMRNTSPNVTAPAGIGLLRF